MPSMGKGGAEKVLINLFKNIDQSKFDIDLCVVMKTGVYLKQIPEEIKTIYLLNNVFLGRVFTYLQIKFNIHFFYRYLVNKKIKDNYDVAISFTDSSYTELLTYINDKPKKLVTWVHASYASYSNFSKYYTEKYKQRIIKHRYNNMDTIVFVSNDSMNDFIPIFGKFKDMRVIYNVLNVEDVIKNSYSYVPELPKKVNLIALGSLFPVKGFDLLIESCYQLKQEGIDFHLTILGDGPLKNKLDQMIDKLNLANHVVLKGFVQNPYPYIKAADIFVMSSISEALPTALCEAMILGRPVVVTESNGCKEIVENGKYGIMSERNSKLFANSLKQLILNKDLRKRYSDLSLEKSKHFNDDVILQEIESVLNI